MSVIVRGIEMPDKCGHCRFATAFECQVTKNFITTFNVRQADCPLIPIPPHGRLIDADALDDAFTDMRWKDGDYRTGKLLHCGDRSNWCLNGGDIEELIQSAPTIIEAEEET